MVVDAVRTYLDAANGLTELSRKQAVAAAKTLLRASGPTNPTAPAAGEGESMPPRVGQSIQTLAGELIETSQSNRAAIADLVRSEVGRQLERMDVVPRAEHDRLVRRVAELERRLAARQVVERVLSPVGAGASSPLRAPVTAEPDASSDDTGSATTAEAETVPVEEGADAEEADDTAPTTAGETSDTPDPEETGDAQDPDTPETGGEDDDAGEAATTGKTAAKKPRTAAKASRPRSGAKRTTKGKGGAKK